MNPQSDPSGGDVTREIRDYCLMKERVVQYNYLLELVLRTVERPSIAGTCCRCKE